MRAVVLVGGEGTRLRPLTFSIPKQMLPVAGLTMIERVLGHLASHGVDEVVLSMGYRPDAFLEAFPEGRAAGVALTYAVEPEPLDTAGAIRFAARHARIDETFVVVNGDVLTDLDLSGLIEHHRCTGAEGTISLTPVEDPSAFGVVSTDERGRVQAFVEKPAPGQAPSNEINAGTYVLEPSVLDRIPDGRRVSVERVTFPAMAAEGRLFARASDAYWVDAGTPQQFLRANADLLSGERSVPPVGGAVERYPGVWVLGDAHLEGSVEGPSLLGPSVEIQAGASVVASVLGPGVVLERGARVENAVVLEGSVLREGAEVSGSIVGRRCDVGAKASIRAITVVGCDATIEPGECLADGRYPASD